MSVRVTSLVWEHAPVSGTDLLVLLVIADHASDDGTNAWPSVDTIARKVRVEPRSVQRALARLEEKRLIGRERQGGGDHRVAGNRRPNRYRVAVDNFAPGVTPASSQPHLGVTPEASRGDTRGRPGVTEVSPKPSLTIQELSHARDENGGELWIDEQGRTWVR